MSNLPPTHGQGMDGFVAELGRMAIAVGYPHNPEYTQLRLLNGEFPHQVRLEVHDIPTVLPNMVVTATGGTFEHACQEAALRMMARMRELHDHDLRNTAYRYHPRRSSDANVSTFRSASGENDTTFGRMCAVMKGLDKMHSDLHKASKALNDNKLAKIASLQDEVARLKKKNAILRKRLAPGGLRIRSMPRKSTTTPMCIQLVHRNPSPPPPALEPLPRFVPPSPPTPPLPSPTPAPAPSPTPALTFAPVSASVSNGSGGWLFATSSNSSGSSSFEPDSYDTYLSDSRSCSEH